jgi:hypothetical protein
LEGAPGTGKTFVIASIRKLCSMIVDERICTASHMDSFVLIVTHNGAPAQKAGARTLDSVVNSFNPKQSLGKVNYSRLKLLIIEESSTIPWWKCVMLSVFLCHSSNGGSGNFMTAFDGISLFCTGDDHQLGPVKCSNIFTTKFEFERILSSSQRTFAGLLSSNFGQLADLQWMIWHEFNSLVNPLQQQRSHFAYTLHHVYRAQDEEWNRVTTHLRHGVLSLPDMDVFQQHDIALANKSPEWVASIVNDTRFLGPDVIVIAHSHRTLAMISRMFYTYNRERASSLKSFSLWDKVAVQLALGERVRFLYSAPGTPIKNGGTGRLVGWLWSKSVDVPDDSIDVDEAEENASSSDDDNIEEDVEGVPASLFDHLSSLQKAPSTLLISLEDLPTSIRSQYSSCFLTGTFGQTTFTANDCVVAVSHPAAFPVEPTTESKRAYAHLSLE